MTIDKEIRQGISPQDSAILKLARNQVELDELIEAREFLEDYLEKDEEAKQHFSTIEEYDDCVASLDEMFQVRIYDLAIYNLTNSLLNELKK